MNGTINKEKVNRLQYRMVSAAMEEELDTLDMVDFSIKNLLTTIGMFYQTLAGAGSSEAKEVVRSLLKFIEDEDENIMQQPLATEEEITEAMQGTMATLGKLGMADDTVGKYIRKKAYS